MNKVIVLAICAFLVLGCDNTATNTDAANNNNNNTQNQKADNTKGDAPAKNQANAEPVIEEIADTTAKAENTENTATKKMDGVVTLDIEGMT
ncbi:hypothetical protein [Candidatus Uabimicrobium amorphum]|uniref:Uncharacterized protein n=1 Tax=Uabimicrobium amorphum TaxID=2596890 RepID=A0A5S9F574_UABAM|nr:hypothetical protein [Candidatus Uabimicrobium amorphum]BBM85863.1 hypothetical protein UABAM_04242 [Candidatus Uabimicrobium amorphum]